MTRNSHSIARNFNAAMKQYRGLAIKHEWHCSVLMARPLRIEYVGAFYHVTSRGDRREDIYHGARDRQVWLEVFSQVSSRFSWRCHAWCLMDNHYHILIETTEGNLSQGMRHLNRVYTQRNTTKNTAEQV